MKNLEKVQDFNKLSEDTVKTLSTEAFVRSCFYDDLNEEIFNYTPSEDETLVSYAGGSEPLNDKTAFLSYITKDTDSNVWLNIQKIDATETEWDYEITRHQLNRDNYFLIRGLRFLNEDVGFMGQTDSIYHIEPQANITAVRTVL